MTGVLGRHVRLQPVRAVQSNSRPRLRAVAAFTAQNASKRAPIQLRAASASGDTTAVDPHDELRAEVEHHANCIRPSPWLSGRAISLGVLYAEEYG